MELTDQLAGTFRGGQAEIQNSAEGYIFRGEIKTITVKDSTLEIRFAWLGKGVGWPPLPTKWVRDDNLDYALGLYACSVSKLSGGDRLCLNSHLVGEIVILFPPGDGGLDRAKVEGL